MKNELDPNRGDHDYFVVRGTETVGHVNGYNDEDALKKAQQRYGENVVVFWRKYVGE